MSSQTDKNTFLTVQSGAFSSPSTGDLQVFFKFVVVPLLYRKK